MPAGQVDVQHIVSGFVERFKPDVRRSVGVGRYHLLDGGRGDAAKTCKVRLDDLLAFIERFCAIIVDFKKFLKVRNGSFIHVFDKVVQVVLLNLGFRVVQQLPLRVEDCDHF